MEQFLQNLIDAIPEPDQSAIEAALARQDSLAKPPHSLGKLEDLSVKLAGMTGKLYNPVDRRRVLIFASDNGIVAEGVASCPQSVTLSQTINFTRGLTGVAVLARHFGADLDVMDVGINADFQHPGVRNLKIAHGTRNFAVEPAMTREQALRAIEIGAEAARRAVGDGIQIVGVGEMGIGNTSTSSAVLSTLTGLPAAQTVSRGAGIGDNAFEKCASLHTMIIPAACTTIGSASFRECSGLTRLELPAAMKKIGGNAFTKCVSLRELVLGSPLPPSITHSSFKGVVMSACRVIVPKGAKNNYRNDKSWAKMPQIVEQQ